MSNTYPSTTIFSANVNILLGANLVVDTGPIANSAFNMLVSNVDLLFGADLVVDTGPIANNLIDLRFIGESVSNNTVTVVDTDTQVWIG